MASSLQVPSMKDFKIIDLLSFPEIFEDAWNDANMGQLLTYLSRASRAPHFPAEVNAVLNLLPWSKFGDVPVAWKQFRAQSDCTFWMGCTAVPGKQIQYARRCMHNMRCAKRCYSLIFTIRTFFTIFVIFEKPVKLHVLGVKWRKNPSVLYGSDFSIFSHFFRISHSHFAFAFRIRILHSQTALQFQTTSPMSREHKSVSTLRCGQSFLMEQATMVKTEAELEKMIQVGLLLKHRHV